MNLNLDDTIKVTTIVKTLNSRKRDYITVAFSVLLKLDDKFLGKSPLL